MFNVCLISLGCDKNTVDSEEMLGVLASRGYNIINDETEADAIIVNTCCFIKDAADESISTIFEMAELKKNRLKYLIVAGCISERYKDEVRAELPEVDAFVGTSATCDIADVIDRLREGSEDPDAFRSLEELPIIEADRVLTGAPYYGYLKIAEGCDKRCTYCAIPSFRGRYRSYPESILLRQAEHMAENGVKELILVAQETTCYGVDREGKKTLHQLINKLSKIEGIEWIRILYAYPEEIYDELIEEMAVNPKVCHYIDMPLQHTEDRILRRMGRRLDKKRIYEIVEKLRDRIPDITIRTTFITGFPGETGEEHEALLDTINELAFDRVGVFTYSPEEGTPAAGFDDQLPEELKESYKNDIMALQQDISYEINQSFVGKSLDVIIEGYIPDDDIYAARSFRDAPDVDGFVFVKCNYEPVSGSIIKARIISAGEYDLIGEAEE